MRVATEDVRVTMHPNGRMDRVERGSLADVVQRDCPELATLVGTGEAASALWR